MAGNTLSVSDVSSKNTATLYLDVTKPKITAEMTQSDDVYLVVPYEDGSGFYVPFTIKDDGSGTNGLNGYFRWRKGTDTYSFMAFDYAVTSSAEKPTEWTRALINNGYWKFTQVEGTQSHSRPIKQGKQSAGCIVGWAEETEQKREMPPGFRRHFLQKEKGCL